MVNKKKSSDQFFWFFFKFNYVHIAIIVFHKILKMFFFFLFCITRENPPNYSETLKKIWMAAKT